MEHEINTNKKDKIHPQYVHDTSFSYRPSYMRIRRGTPDSFLFFDIIPLVSI